MDFNMLKREKGLELPPASAIMNYSVAIKTEAMLRLGMYNIVRKIKLLIRKPAEKGVDNAFSALKDAVSRMKKETAESLIFHFKNYNENIKFQYIFKFIDLISDRLYSLMMERFHDYSQDLSGAMSLTAVKQVDKEQMFSSLRDVESGLNALSDRIAEYQKQVNMNFAPA
jgi:hypothetical protein